MGYVYNGIGIWDTMRCPKLWDMDNYEPASDLSNFEGSQLWTSNMKSHDSDSLDPSHFAFSNRQQTWVYDKPFPRTLKIDVYQALKVGSKSMPPHTLCLEGHVSEVAVHECTILIIAARDTEQHILYEF